MIIDGIEFNYEVKSIDIDSAHMVVEYTPTDPELMPIKLNVAFVEHRGWKTDPVTNEAVGFDIAQTFEEHKEYSIKSAAPVSHWRRQKLLLQNL